MSFEEWYGVRLPSIPPRPPTMRYKIGFDSTDESSKSAPAAKSTGLVRGLDSELRGPSPGARDPEADRSKSASDVFRDHEYDSDSGDDPDQNIGLYSSPSSGARTAAIIARSARSPGSRVRRRHKRQSSWHSLHVRTGIS